MLDLTTATWKVIYHDGTIIDDPKLYKSIDRKKIDEFVITIKNTDALVRKYPSFRIKTKGKTLIRRLKTKFSTISNTSLYNRSPIVSITPKNKSEIIPKINQQRILITALLKKNIYSSKNKKYHIIQNDKLVQEYFFDPRISEIYYTFEDDTIEKRNDFGVTSPYLPFPLHQEELTHLNG